jgi:hypothetical protein
MPRGLPHVAPPRLYEDSVPECPLHRIFFTSLEPGDLSMFTAFLWTGVLFVYISQQYSAPKPQSSSMNIGFVILALFYICHYSMIIMNRWNLIGLMALYEGLWVCSLALPLSAIGLVLRRYEMVGAAVSSVLTGHVIWFIDTMIMVSLGDFKRSDQTLGIADYGDANGDITVFSFWCETHHIWFIPSGLWILYQTGTKYRFKEVCYGYVWVMCLSIFTALVMPQPCIPVKGKCLVSNVNMVRSWWGVESLKFLHWFDYQDGHTTVWMSWGYNNFWYFCLNCFMWGTGKLIHTALFKSKSDEVDKVKKS